MGPKEVKKGSGTGMFYLRNRFTPIEIGQVWFNEERKPFGKGYGANHIRSMTFLVGLDLYSNKKILVVNTHLDHLVAESVSNSVRIIAEECEILSKKYQVENIFVGGDFNIDESS